MIRKDILIKAFVKYLLLSKSEKAFSPGFEIHKMLWKFFIILPHNITPLQIEKFKFVLLPTFDSSKIFLNYK